MRSLTKVKFSSSISLNYKSLIGPKRRENIDLKSQEWYYIVSIYNYYQLILFVVLIEKFNQKSNFRPQLASLDLIRAE